MESLYLKTFMEVVRTGSLSRAAETLHVTQPAVSRRIKFMEDHYGCVLLDRSGSVLRPTEAGCLVYDRARSLLEIESALVSGLHHLSGKARVSLTCSPAFGIAHLPAVLREFMLSCGGSIDLKFIFNTPDEILKGLQAGLFDVAIMEMCDRVELGSFATFELPGDEMVFVGSPKLGLPDTLTSLDPLLGISLFARREGCCSRALLERNLSRVGHQIQDFKRVIVFDDLHIIVKAVVDGEGLTFLSRDLLEDRIASGDLRPYSPPDFLHRRERRLVLGRSAPSSMAVRRFVEALFGHFSLPVPPSLAGSPNGLPETGGALSDASSGPAQPAARTPHVSASPVRRVRRTLRRTARASGRAGR